MTNDFNKGEKKDFLAFIWLWLGNRKGELIPLFLLLLAIWFVSSMDQPAKSSSSIVVYVDGPVGPLDGASVSLFDGDTLLQKGITSGGKVSFDRPLKELTLFVEKTGFENRTLQVNQRVIHVSLAEAKPLVSPTIAPLPTSVPLKRRVDVTVLMPETNEPVAGAKVNITSLDKKLLAKGTTNASGVFSAKVPNTTVVASVEVNGSIVSQVVLKNEADVSIISPVAAVSGSIARLVCKDERVVVGNYTYSLSDVSPVNVMFIIYSNNTVFCPRYSCVYGLNQLVADVANVTIGVSSIDSKANCANISFKWG